MITPAEAARQFLDSLILGGCLGLTYSFLRPLRPRFTGLSDLLFLAALF